MIETTLLHWRSAAALFGGLCFAPLASVSCSNSGEDEECQGENCADAGGIQLGNLGGSGDGRRYGGDDEECIDVQVDFAPSVPNVVLLIDQSGSMNAGAGFGSAVTQAPDYAPWDCPAGQQDWRWNVVRNVLLHPERGVVRPLEDRVRFGLALYSSDNGTQRGAQCPSLTEVEVDFATHAQMLGAFSCSDLIEDTPTRESLTAVAERLANSDLDGPKVIVLATDGAPDNCACPDWGSQVNAADDPPESCFPSNLVERNARMMSPEEAEQFDTVEEARRIAEDLGIAVEVINVSSPSDADLKAHLDEVAQAGGAVSGASIDGFDPHQLTRAFETIIEGVRSCVIDLEGQIATGEESAGTILLDVDPSSAVDFQPLTLDDADGWRVNTPQQIELLGSACATIKAGNHELDISFPCGTFVPPTR